MQTLVENFNVQFEKDLLCYYCQVCHNFDDFICPITLQFAQLRYFVNGWESCSFTKLFHGKNLRDADKINIHCAWETVRTGYKMNHVISLDKFSEHQIWQVTQWGH